MTEPQSTEQPFWVFGYGSLMWDPGFAPETQHLARLDGYTRRFCLWSVRYRGTPESPGLVLGLDRVPDSHCVGVAYQVAAANAAEVWAYLKQREMVTYAYQEAKLPVTLLGDAGDSVEQVSALCYVLDRNHAQYAGHLTLEDRAKIVIRSRGAKGDNHSYLRETVRHLRELGVRDVELEEFNSLVEKMMGRPE